MALKIKTIAYSEKTKICYEVDGDGSGYGENEK